MKFLLSEKKISGILIKFTSFVSIIIHIMALYIYLKFALPNLVMIKVASMILTYKRFLKKTE